MTLCTIRPATTVEVRDYQTLMKIWPVYREDPTRLVLVGNFVVEKPLTQAQRRRLPKGLKTKLRCSVAEF